MILVCGKCEVFTSRGCERASRQGNGAVLGSLLSCWGYGSILLLLRSPAVKSLIWLWR